MPLTEQEEIEAWKRLQLVVLEFDTDAVERLLAANVDLHRAIDLIRGGCPHNLALEILL